MRSSDCRRAVTSCTVPDRRFAARRRRRPPGLKVKGRDRSVGVEDPMLQFQRVALDAGLDDRRRDLVAVFRVDVLEELVQRGLSVGFRQPSSGAPRPTRRARESASISKLPRLAIRCASARLERLAFNSSRILRARSMNCTRCRSRGAWIGLAAEIGRSGEERLVDGFVVVAPGQHQDRHVAAAGALAQGAARREAVHARHQDVEHHQVGGALPEQGDRIAAARGFHDLEAVGSRISATTSRTSGSSSTQGAGSRLHFRGAWSLPSRRREADRPISRWAQAGAARRGIPSPDDAVRATSRAPPGRAAREKPRRLAATGAGRADGSTLRRLAAPRFALSMLPRCLRSPFIPTRRAHRRTPHSGRRFRTDPGRNIGSRGSGARAPARVFGGLALRIPGGRALMGRRRPGPAWRRDYVEWIQGLHHEGQRRRSGGRRDHRRGLRRDRRLPGRRRADPGHRHDRRSAGFLRDQGRDRS